MAEIVAGAIISVSFEKLIDLITSQSGYVYDFIKRMKANDRLLLWELRMKLLSANSLVGDAEAKQLENPYVRKWLAELKLVMYDADELVDLIDAEALRCKIEEGESARSLQKVRNFISTAFNRRDVESKTKQITDRLETVLQQKDFLGLKGGVRKRPSTRTKDDDKKGILKLLLPDKDVHGANLKDKKAVTGLHLEWRGDSDDSRAAREVLDRLQPHANIRELEIHNYGGTGFPGWFGYESFSCIKEVKLFDCKNCIMLPALGQLPSLEELVISGFDMLEKIGNEFYSDAHVSSSSSSSMITKSFKSLKRLEFSRMPEWMEWSVMVELDGGSNNGGSGAFSNLEELVLDKCPKLKWACLPECLPSLKTLKIESSDHLVPSFSTNQYPSLLRLEIQWCKNLKAFPAEGSLLPSNIQSIEFVGCSELASFSEEGWPSSLTSLTIRFCEKLFATKQWNLGILTSLTSLVIRSISEVKDTFPEKEGQLPTSLTSLKLSRMPNLKSLNGKAFQCLTSLKYLSIYNCRQLQCLAEETLPPSISQLWISQCPLLEPRCQRETGEDWSKIHHIPSIKINYKAI